MKITFPDLQELKKGFRTLRPAIARRSIGAALKRAMEPARKALKTTTPKGPTGNLQKAIDVYVKKYKNGNAVGLVGYRKPTGAGKQRKNKGGTVRKGANFAYHQAILEVGNKRRRATEKGSIASSYNRLGNFKLKKPPKRGKFAGSTRVQTTPKYPKAFFKRAPSGQRVDLGDMSPGGSKGQPPVKAAYKMSAGKVRALLPKEMTRALNAAMAQQFRPFLNNKPVT